MYGEMSALLQMETCKEHLSGVIAMFSLPQSEMIKLADFPQLFAILSSFGAVQLVFLSTAKS